MISALVVKKSGKGHLKYIYQGFLEINGLL
jgi:hypothetical protein